MDQNHRTESFRHPKINSPNAEEKPSSLFGNEEKSKTEEEALTSNQNIPRVTSLKSGTITKPEERNLHPSSSLSQVTKEASQSHHQHEDKQKSTPQDQGTRLVSLPSLSPKSSSTESQQHFENKESEKNSHQHHTTKPAHHTQHAVPHHLLSVQVDDSMDEPISYPPTAAFPTQPHFSAEPEFLPSKSPMKPGSVTFGPDITVPTNNNTSTPTSAKKILKRTGSGGDLASPQAQPLQVTTPKRQSMPTWLSPNNSIDLGGSTSPLSRSRDTAALRHVQEKLEEVTLQKDATERYLRLEIESLKNRLDVSQNLSIDFSQQQSQPPSQPQPGPSSQSSEPTQQQSSSSSANSQSHPSQVTTTTHFSSSSSSSSSHEIDELKSRIRALQEENRLLKEESMIDKIKHQRELSQLKEKHQADLDLGNISKVEEITLLEKRHRDTIEALKKIHLDELSAIKQRAKDGVALDQLSSQIATTTGSLKLIEEQMNLKYRGVDAVREGQYEARERLLLEMESKAVERAEIAEAEGYKLKGLLSHMEQV
jgi:hypothetical protein